MLYVVFTEKKPGVVYKPEDSFPIAPGTGSTF